MLQLNLARNAVGLLRASWERTQSLPLGRKLFGKVFGQIVPYTGSISPEVLELAPGRARVRMADRRAVRNHLNSVHAMAMANLGEAATGLALIFSLPENFRAILVDFRIEYLKKARGDLTATAIFDAPEVFEEGTMQVVGTIQNATLEVVARVTAVWKVGLNK